MADFANSPTDALTQDATTLLTGLRDNPDLLAGLADYEIELDDEVATGLALLDALQSAIGEQGAEAAQAVHATASADAAIAALRTGYVRHRKLGRSRHPRGTAGYSALRLAGDTPDAEDALIGDTSAFYAALDADPALYAGIRGLTRKAVSAGLARVAAARAAETGQAREEGEAQEATVRRQVAEASLRVLCADIAVAVEDAYHDQPQRRERLGLFQRGSR